VTDRTYAYDIQFSYSSLDAYDKCPESMRQQYITKKYKRTFTPQITDGVDAAKALEDRIKAKTPLPAPLAAKAEGTIQALEQRGVVEAEVKFAVNHWWQPVGFWDGWLRGQFDVVLRDHEKRKALIMDWKTGNGMPYEKPDQLEIGAHLLMTADPEIDQVVGFNVWLKPGKLGQSYIFVRGDGATARWTKKMRDIETLKRDVVWEKKPSGLCGWCPNKDCENYKGG
jgi:PD-(D/E)XK nuclease superfamily